jgi:DNA transformation protein
VAPHLEPDGAATAGAFEKKWQGLSPVLLAADPRSRAGSLMTSPCGEAMIARMDDELIADIFSGLGPVTTRRMFSGGELMLKADAISAPEFAEAGARQFTYPHRRSGKTVEMPYWTVPESALDDSDEMARWTRKAYEAALRSAGQSA